MNVLRNVFVSNANVGVATTSSVGELIVDATSGSLASVTSRYVNNSMDIRTYANNTVIKNTEFEDADLVSVAHIGSGSLFFENNVVSQNTGGYFANVFSYGLGGASAQIINNQTFENETGQNIFLNNTFNSTISDNTLSGRAGIKLNGGSNNNILENNFPSNRPIWLFNSPNSEVVENICTFGGGISLIVQGDCGGSNIECNVLENPIGLNYFGGTTGPQFLKGNRFLTGQGQRAFNLLNQADDRYFFDDGNFGQSPGTEFHPVTSAMGWFLFAMESEDVKQCEKPALVEEDDDEDDGSDGGTDDDLDDETDTDDDGVNDDDDDDDDGDGIKDDEDPRPNGGCTDGPWNNCPDTNRGPSEDPLRGIPYILNRMNIIMSGASHGSFSEKAIQADLKMYSLIYGISRHCEGDCLQNVINKWALREGYDASILHLLYPSVFSEENTDITFDIDNWLREKDPLFFNIATLESQLHRALAMNNNDLYIIQNGKNKLYELYNQRDRLYENDELDLSALKDINLLMRSMKGYITELYRNNAIEQKEIDDLIMICNQISTRGSTTLSAIKLVNGLYLNHMSDTKNISEVEVSQLKEVADDCIDNVGSVKYYAQSLHTMLTDSIQVYQNECDVTQRERKYTSDNSESELRIFPNPVSNMCNVVLDRLVLEDQYYRIVDILGVPQLELIIRSGTDNNSFDVSAWPDGYYFLEHPSGETSKFVVVK